MKDSEKTNDYIESLLNSPTVKEYKEEEARISYGWQYVLRNSISLEDRFEEDCNAYKEYLNDPIYPSAIEFDEDDLIEILLKKLDSSEHPYFNAYAKFLRNLRESLKQERTKKPEQDYSSAGLAIKNYLYLLKDVIPPVIDETNKFLLGSKQKGSIAAFIHILTERGKFKKTPDPILAKFLNDNIEGLELSQDGRSLRTYTSATYKEYHKQFQDLI